MQDVRWQQRFQNYLRALQTLDEAAELARVRALTRLEQQGLIQGFEFTHELAWNLLKDYLEAKGFTDLIGSKDATRTAFKNGLIEAGEVWMEMIRARNLTSHSYSSDIAQAVVDDVLLKFYPAFVALAKDFTTRHDQHDIDS
ncbi:MAG: nucleotidyltransferase substrate binding protein [Magnetococcales bacterium]|nr:nucleotidyltransferase substrate binding protein [Magnetococcales bacterium]